MPRYQVETQVGQHSIDHCEVVDVDAKHPRHRTKCRGTRKDCQEIADALNQTIWVVSSPCLDQDVEE
jgi:hypothetical protein